MAKINLLDWREEIRNERQIQFAVAAAVALAIAGSIIGAVYAGFGAAIDYQNLRNDFLKREIKIIEQKIAEIQELDRVKADLRARMQVIQSLQQSRSRTVHFFDEIVETIPDGVYIKTLTQKGTATTIDGVAESNGRVSTYMKNIEASPWFDNPTLVVIRAKAGPYSRVSEFKLKFTNRPKPKGEGGDEEEAQ